jgi:two-component system, sensor histidine kinase and response regulator
MTNPAPVKVLLVDDVEDNLLILETLLARPGVELLSARSGREALELLLVHEVALALLDVQMPEIDGFELAALMRGSERTKKIPIVFVTAGAHDLRRVFQGFELGAVDFLVKPIEPGILRHKVNVFIELYRQREQLREALRVNETFVGVLAHDLRTPLSAMIYGADILEESSDEQAQRVAKSIKSSGFRMARLIEQLCDLTRARMSGGIVVHPTLVDLGPLVANAVREVETGGERRVELQMNGELTGLWDADRIAQVLSNLLGNAVRHGKPGALVKLSAEGSDAAVLVTVENRGTIQADALPGLFEPFKEAREADKKRDGLGLGLYIVRELVEAHGGRIEVEVDAENETVRFSVTLPRK